MSLLRALLISALIAPAVVASAASASDSTENLKLRVQGYVDAMMDGKRATILAHKDYYSTIFLASSGKVTQVEAEENGVYRATLVFKTSGRYLQDMESQPHTAKKAPGMGELQKSVTFTITPTSLHWRQPLESPFVKPGKESRYLMKSP